MTDEEKVRDESLANLSLEFDPIANSTMIDDDTTEPSSPKPQTRDQRMRDKPPDKGSEPHPSSVCFADQFDSEEPTRPIGPMQNSDKIVSETQDVITNLFQLMMKQRRFLLVCAYQISSLYSIVKDHYDPLLSKMETFLTYCNRLQTEWFFQYYRLLPQYADYALVLEDKPAKVIVDGIPNAVKESTLKYLAEDTVNNMFAGGLQVKLQRSLNTDVSLKMEFCREAFQMEDLPLKLWMDLFEAQSENAKKVEETCFELLSSVDLLNVDDNLMPKTKYLRLGESMSG